MHPTDEKSFAENKMPPTSLHIGVTMTEDASVRDARDYALVAAQSLMGVVKQMQDEAEHLRGRLKAAEQDAVNAYTDLGRERLERQNEKQALQKRIDAQSTEIGTRLEKLGELQRQTQEKDIRIKHLEDDVRNGKSAVSGIEGLLKDRDRALTTKEELLFRQGEEITRLQKMLEGKTKSNGLLRQEVDELRDRLRAKRAKKRARKSGKKQEGKSRQITGRPMRSSLLGNRT